jgi:hypothetical protein
LQWYFDEAIFCSDPTNGNVFSFFCMSVAIFVTHFAFLGVTRSDLTMLFLGTFFPFAILNATFANA